MHCHAMECSLSREFGICFPAPYMFKFDIVVHDYQDSSTDRPDTDILHERTDARIMFYRPMYLAHVQFQYVLLVAQCIQCIVWGEYIAFSALTRTWHGRMKLLQGEITGHVLSSNPPCKACTLSYATSEAVAMCLEKN